MSLEDVIKDIQRRLKNGEYVNEQAIMQGIVLRLLAAMDWPVYDTNKVAPEYRVQNMRVDLALCVKPKKPDIFIEVKQPGLISSAEEQLLNYAFRQGIRVAIATDGREWYFYWPSGKDDYKKRRFREVHLINDDVTKTAEGFRRYLLFDDVVSGEAFKNAAEDYEKLRIERDAMGHIPEAWKELLEKRCPIIVKAISDAVENLCDHPPVEEDVIEYLKSLVKIEKKKDPEGPIDEEYNPPRTKIKVTFPTEEVISKNIAKETFIEALRKIGFDVAAQVGINTAGYPLISRQQHDARWESVREGFFIYKGSDTATKIKQLKEISRRLNLGLKIELVNY